MDGGEEAGAQVVVQVFVLAHLKHFLPLPLSHLALDALCSLLLLPQLLSTKLQQRQHISNESTGMFRDDLFLYYLDRWNNDVRLTPEKGLAFFCGNT